MLSFESKGMDLTLKTKDTQGQGQGFSATKTAKDVTSIIHSTFTCKDCGCGAFSIVQA